MRTKVAFIRDGAFLMDPPGARDAVVMYASTFGEGPTESERAAYIRDVSSDDVQRRRQAILALGPERSPEFCDALLTAIAMDTAVAASASVRFANDPRIRHALVAAVERVALERVADFAGALGSVGGRDALPALRRRFEQAKIEFQGFSSAPHFDHAASRLGSLSGAILRLDPDAIDAAQTMYRLFAHPLPMNRTSALREAVDVFRSRLQTEAMRLLTHGFDRALHAGDPDAFLVVVPIMASEHFEYVRERCGGMLRDGDPNLSEQVIHALATIPFPYTGRALAIVASWICQHASSREIRPSTAALVHDFLPDEVTVAILRRALAAEPPSLRLDAIRYIERLAPELASLVVGDALLDEPDPTLRHMLHALAWNP